MYNSIILKRAESTLRINPEIKKQGDKKLMLNKKICVVVGGAKGRGSSLVEEYAGRSYHIAFMDIDKESGKLLKEKVEEEYGKKVFFFHGSADSEEDLELFAGAVIGQYKKVDCVYYHTGITERAQEIGDLLRENIKKGGIVEAFC